MALYGPGNGQELIPIGSAVDTILVWTLGISLFTYGTNSRVSGLREKLLNPIMLSIVGMLLLNSLHLRLPQVLLEVCGDIGKISSSLGLLYLGYQICFMPRVSLSAVRHVVVIILLKLLIVPLCLYAVFSRLLPETEAIVLMLVAAAPSMTTSTMIANQYGLDEDYAAACVFLTTISCMVTIPLLFMMISVI